jgi:hypothetical protein
MYCVSIPLIFIEVRLGALATSLSITAEVADLLYWKELLQGRRKESEKGRQGKNKFLYRQVQVSHCGKATRRQLGQVVACLSDTV